MKNINLKRNLIREKRNKLRRKKLNEFKIQKTRIYRREKDEEEKKKRISIHLRYKTF